MSDLSDFELSDFSQFETDELSDIPSDIQSNYNNQTQVHIIPPDAPKIKVSMPRVYVITRTSGRKYFFHENYLSIQKQNYPFITQLVTYDDDDTKQYVQKYEDIHLLDWEDFKPHQLKSFEMKRPPTPRRGSTSLQGSFPYNLYLNQIMDEISSKMEPGWIMFLDDDDLFCNHRCVTTMITWIAKERIKADNNFLMWQVEFPNGRLVPRNIKRPPRIGEVSMIGFMFHSMWVPKLRFENRKGGDFLMIKKLHDFLTPIWIPDVLTKVNYDSIRRFGSGKRRDKSLSTGQIKEYKLFWESKMSKPKKKISLSLKKPANSLILEEDDSMDEFDNPSLESLSIPDQNDSVKEMSEEEEDSLGLDDSLDLGENFDLSPKLKLKLKANKISPIKDEELPPSESDDEPEEEEPEEEEPEEESEGIPKINLKKVTFKQANPTPSGGDRRTPEPTQGEVEYPDQETENQENQEEQEEDEMMIHPQLEKLLDLLSDKNKVQIVSLRELKDDIRADIQVVVKNAVQECLQDMLPELSQPHKQGKIGHLVSKRQLLKEKSEQRRSQRSLSKLHRAIEDDSTVSQPSNTSKQVKLSRNNIDTVHRTEVKKSLKRQLADLDESEDGGSSQSESRRLSKLLVNYAEEEGEGEAPVDLTGMDQFLDKIFILNLTDKASELQYRFESFGFTDVQVVDFNKRRRDFWGNLWDLMKLASKKGYHRIGVFQDNIHLHKNFQEELAAHFEKMQSKDWKLIAVSAAQSLTTKSALDWKYYLETYPDLRKNGKIKDENGAKKHWKLNGSRERRYSQRGLLHPDSLAGVTGVLISAKFFKDLPKMQKARDPRQFILRNYLSHSYATSPLLALNEINRMVKMRNRHNLEFYEINQ